jgi:hypothetical protein
MVYFNKNKMNNLELLASVCQLEYCKNGYKYSILYLMQFMNKTNVELQELYTFPELKKLCSFYSITKGSHFQNKMGLIGHIKENIDSVIFKLNNKIAYIDYCIINYREINDDKTNSIISIQTVE